MDGGRGGRGCATKRPLIFHGRFRAKRDAPVIPAVTDTAHYSVLSFTVPNAHPAFPSITVPAGDIPEGFACCISGRFAEAAREQARNLGHRAHIAGGQRQDLQPCPWSGGTPGWPPPNGVADLHENITDPNVAIYRSRNGGNGVAPELALVAKAPGTTDVVVTFMHAGSSSGAVIGVAFTLKVTAA